MYTIALSLLDWIGRIITMNTIVNSSQLKVIINVAVAKVGSLDMVSQQKLTAAIEQKVKAGWSREGAEASVLWENGIIDDDEFQALMKSLKLGK